MREKALTFEEQVEELGLPSSRLLSLNPWGELPVLIDQHVVCPNSYVACEYLEEVYTSTILMGESPAYRVEVRRLMAWFDKMFYQDVYWTLFYEKILKFKLKKVPPDTRVLQKGYHLLHEHMDYLEQLAETNHFLAGKTFSWADISAAAHLSCIDYLGDIHWKEFPCTKEWYEKIKSRPAFRPFLEQTRPGIQAVEHYKLLDF